MNKSVVEFLHEIANKLLASADTDKNIINAIADGMNISAVTYAKDNLSNKIELTKEILNYAKEIIDFIEKGE